MAGAWIVVVFAVFLVWVQSSDLPPDAKQHQQCQPRTASLIQTARDTGDRLQPQADVSFIPDFETQDPVVELGGNGRGVGQPLIGFGGAFTEASANVFWGLNAALRQEIIEKYFDAQQGIGYVVGRVPINSCDFSTSSYSFDDVPGDFDLIHFDKNVTRDSGALIPFIRAAMQQLQKADREIKVLASPWSPPAWMKTNGAMLNSSEPGLRPDSHNAWAMYFAKWIEAYKAQGVPVWAITVQNEPSGPIRWECCVYSAHQEANFLGQHLGPLLHSLHPEVKIFVFDDHQKQLLRNWTEVIYSHASASTYAAGVAFHWYDGDAFEIVDHLHRSFPEALLLSTEVSYEKWRWSNSTTLESGDWSFGEGYGHDIIGNLNAGATGWIDWNLLLDRHGGPNHLGNECDAAMMADVDAQRLYIHPQYYYVGHFSKFILQGSRRIPTTVTGSTPKVNRTRPYGTCTAEDGLQAVAFERPDSSMVVVVLNCGGKPIDFKLKSGMCALRLSIPAHAIQTYRFDQTQLQSEVPSIYM